MNSGELLPESRHIVVRVPAGASIVLRIEVEAVVHGTDRPTHPSASQARQTSVDRFWVDWCRRCLPLPVGMASTASLFASHRHWAQLQDLPHALTLADFVQGCVVRHLAHKARTLAFLPGADMPRQVSVIVPYGEPMPTGQKAVGTAVAAFDTALARWKAAPRAARGGGGSADAA